MHVLLSQFIHLCEDRRSHHVLYLDFTSALVIEEKEKFPNTSDDIERVEGLTELLELRKGRHQLKNVILEIFFF
jgi:hypothetical protein